MMNSLMGVLSSTVMSMVEEKTQFRFKNPDSFVTPEALVLYEQRILDEDQILDLCIQEYNLILSTPRITYIPREVIQEFASYKCIVLEIDVETNSVTLGMLPEYRDQAIFSDHYQIKKKVFVPIYYYCKVYAQQYGEPDFLVPLPTKDLLDLIYQEALAQGASDITISTTSKGAQVYFNVRKHKVHANRRITKDDVEMIAQLIASSASATMDMALTDSRPRYFSIDIDKQNRGRVVINKTYYGRLITIRVLPNEVLTATVETLNLNQATCDFIRQRMLSLEKGLRLFIGETMSGKNTSILASLNELVQTDRYKIVSVEQPVEILVDGIEQINAETNEEFEANADSLLRQNPDFVYFTEITARTASSIMQQANTAKAVFSTIHANSISDVLFRLEDITHMQIDRLILTLHSCIYQELVRNDATDTIQPYTRCMYFSDELKMKLYGHDIATIKTVLQQEEDKWERTVNAVNRGLVELKRG